MRSIRSAAALAALLLATTPAAYAQETTATVRGEVVDPAGKPVSGAEVVITHLPSGTVARTTTDTQGQYFASGLRPGGPFSIAVSASGYDNQSVNDVALAQGEVTRVTVNLNPVAIVVTGTRTNPVYNLTTGPVTALNTEEIKSVASVTRDIRDIVRRNPFATIDYTNSRAIEIAGQNGRLNRFSVDGVRFSDNFGLNNGGLPTNRGPVPLDAIEQLQVKVAPYDISSGDLQGADINVVLRSGTNKFTGSAFYTYTGDSLTGDTTGTGTTRRNIKLKFNSDNYGGFIAGPIIKDKLFFSFSYERLKEGQPLDIGLASLNFAQPVPGLTQATIDSITATANSRYNFNPGGVFTTTTENDEKATAKIDWNASDRQRVSFTYIYNNGTNQFQQNASIGPASPSLGLSSNAYQLGETINSGILQLNSQWTDKFSTETRVSYRNYERTQVSLGGLGIAQFEICTDATNVNNNPTVCNQGSSAAPGTPRVVFGPDISRQANYLNVETWQGDVTARYQAGDHIIKGYFVWQHQDVYNLFVQRAIGDYYFDTIANYQAGNADRFRYGGAVGGLDPAARYNYNQFTFGLQDSWDITPTLNVTAGLRYDFWVSGSKPVVNNFFVQRYGFDNQETYDGRDVIQPRFGFSWKPVRRAVVRGGFGLFAGGTPDVWLSNSFSVTGIQTNQIDIQRTATGFSVPGLTGAQAAAVGAAALNNVNGRTIDPLVLNYLQTNVAALSSSSANAIAKNYEVPSTWKGSLSADYRANLGPLGDNWNFGIDLLYTQVNNAADYRDIRSVVIGTLPDGRPRYAAALDPLSTTGARIGGTNQDLLLTNTDKGRAFIGVVRFDKRFDFGLNVGASYTRQDVKDVNGTTSATAGSQYGNNQFVDPNQAAYGRSIYETTNAVKFNIGYAHAFWKDYKTRLQIFGEWRNGRPYSLTMTDPAAGRSPVFGTLGSSSRYLLYVPNVSAIDADARVSYDSQATFNAFQSFVQTRGLKQGAIISKNTQTSPDFFKVDLHFDQELPLPTWHGYRPRVRAFADLENLLNLIDPSWGQLRQVGFPYNAAVVNVACAITPVASGTALGTAQATASTQACQQYRYSNFSNPAVAIQGRQSLWSLRIGVKFEF